MGAIRSFNKPRKINRELTVRLHSEVVSRLNGYGKEVSSKVDIYVTNTRCGRCYYKGGKATFITIPSWVFRSGKCLYGQHQLETSYEEVRHYYLAHELAHVVTPGNHHGQWFMEEFKKICAECLQYIEYGYKPRNASSAGVAMRG